MDSPLKKLRESTGLSAYAFSKEAGIASQYYWILEQGKTNMQMKTTVKIARVLADKLKRSPSDVLAELTQINEAEKQPVTAA